MPIPESRRTTVRQRLANSTRLLHPNRFEKAGSMTRSGQDGMPLQLSSR
jgi:hypothetical protein